MSRQRKAKQRLTKADAPYFAVWTVCTNLWIADERRLAADAFLKVCFYAQVLSRLARP